MKEPMSPPQNNYGDSQPDPLHQSPVPSTRLTLGDLRDEMRDEFRMLRKELAPLKAFLDGQRPDGADGVKIRLDRLEQDHAARAKWTAGAVAASGAALIGTVMKWLLSGGAMPPGGGH